MDDFLHRTLVAAGAVEHKTTVKKTAPYRYLVTCPCGFRSNVDAARRGEADRVAETHKRNMRILERRDTERGGAPPDGSPAA